MPRKPATTWEMLNVAMSHFQNYINSKTDRCSLSIVDLLHVSNFKGGNASITEPVETLSGKLTHYEAALKKIEESFDNKSLVSLNDNELKCLKEKCSNFIALTNAQASEIRGFGPSYASALMAAHFPNLIPVLDRRALNGAGIKVKYNSQNQVRNIVKHYGALIEAFRSELKKHSASNMTLRQLDKCWFSKPLTRRSTGRAKAARR